MLESSKELANEHTFGSRPSWWPLMRRGVAFWIARDNNVRFTRDSLHLTFTKPSSESTANCGLKLSFQAQIFCIGNPFVWWVTTLSLPVYFGLLMFYLLRRRRKVYDLSKGWLSKHYEFDFSVKKVNLFCKHLFLCPFDQIHGSSLCSAVKLL